MPARKKPKAKPPAPAKKSKRPVRDVNQLAQFLVQTTTENSGEAEMPASVTGEEIRRVMAELGRRGGKIGGVRRAESLTADKRREIALKAARSRWDRPADQ